MTSMKSGFGIFGGFALLAMLGATPAAGSFRCLPTCDVRDGRFLAIAGSGFDTLSPPELALSIAVPAGSTSFDLGVFDGDGGEYDPFGDANWDSGVTALFSYSLYADPDADGVGLIPVDLAPGSPTVYSPDMPDNQWLDFTVSTGPAAQSPSGNYFYVLKVNLVVPALVTLNSFKVRTSAILSGLTLDPVERPFSYVAPWTALTDISIVYPNFPDPLPTTYDGSFRFFFDVPVSQSQLAVWDGDFDRGKFDGTEQDTNDPNTPGFPFVPSWATLDTLPEGVAIGGSGTGSPADDTDGADFGVYVLREPSVRYELTLPGGSVLANENPSGNQEWERFSISTAPFDPAQMDYSVPAIPPGVYKLEILGVDMLNLNALLLPFRVLCVEETGEPCTPLRPYLLGDTVFFDADGDGSQDPGEPGIGGVLLQLYDARGTLLASTTTDADGHYSFGVEKESYEVRVAASSFSGPLAPLAGTASTTGGNSRARTIASGNNALDVDFGYRGTGSIGDRVWKDLDGDGVQDAGETGLNGVTVRLLDEDGNVVATTVTSGDGNYSFGNLSAGSYTVQIVTSTLPAGMTPTYDADGTGTPSTAAVTLAAGGATNIIDFGYRVPTTITIGDRVWRDLDGDGVQDAGETGLNGITVRLLDNGGNLVATAVTSGDGNYSFTGLAPGTYTVQVVTATLPAGMTPTYDADGIATPHAAKVTVSGSRPDVDFGYRAPATTQPGTGTLGYWKNHPEAWPVPQITIGGRTYSKAQAISLMSSPGKGDKAYDMFKQLVAAKLNVLIGNDASCISATISAADSWMGTYPVGSKVSSSSAAWAVGGPLHTRLDDYNNGRLCAPHRD